MEKGVRLRALKNNSLTPKLTPFRTAFINNYKDLWKMAKLKMA
jgi:hypothetical protein